MKHPLIGKTVKLRPGTTMVGDLTAKVLRCSPLGTLTVELMEGRKAYKVGDHLHVGSWEVEEITTR